MNTTRIEFAPGHEDERLTRSQQQPHTQWPLEAVGNLVRTTVLAERGERPSGILVAECFDAYGLPHTPEAYANAQLFASATALHSIVRRLASLREGLANGSSAAEYAAERLAGEAVTLINDIGSVAPLAQRVTVEDVHGEPQ